jgi:hypothetical protein
MEDVIEDHISDGALEEYSLDTLAESRVALIEEHLQVCEHCRARLEAIEPLNFVHFTEDGPILSRATRLATGKVMARHWGKELDGGQLTLSTTHENHENAVRLPPSEPTQGDGADGEKRKSHDERAYP